MVFCTIALKGKKKRKKKNRIQLALISARLQGYCRRPLLSPNPNYVYCFFIPFYFLPQNDSTRAYCRRCDNDTLLLLKISFFRYHANDEQCR
jgi:hypothetical protein